MAKNSIQPKPGQVYTLAEIYRELELRDSAFLRFPFLSPTKRETDEWRASDEYAPRERMQVIQTCHLREAELLATPGWAETRWEYERETNEWIPLFTLASPLDELLKLVDMEPDNDKYYDPMAPRWWWVTPKAFPRQQYYNERGEPNP